MGQLRRAGARGKHLRFPAPAVACVPPALGRPGSTTRSRPSSAARARPPKFGRPSSAARLRLTRVRPPEFGRSEFGRPSSAARVRSQGRPVLSLKGGGTSRLPKKRVWISNHKYSDPLQIKAPNRASQFLPCFLSSMWHIRGICLINSCSCLSSHRRGICAAADCPTFGGNRRRLCESSAAGRCQRTPGSHVC